MKQALIITAYKDFDQLFELLGLFDDDFNFYIHIDKKAYLPECCRTAILNIENVKHLRQDYKVNWGGVNHLHAYLELAEVALKDETNQFFHLITAQDHPVSTLDHMRDVAKNAIDENKNYISFFTLPSKNWENGGLDRLTTYNLYDFLDAKKHLRFLERTRNIQRKLGLKRSMSELPSKLFGGSTYWSLNRNCIQYVIDFTKKNEKFFRRFKYTFCAEEIYFQTVIMNSVFASSVVNNNLRFIDWKSGRGGRPAFLDETDFPEMVSSGDLFARKIKKTQLSLLAKLREHNRKADACE